MAWFEHGEVYEKEPHSPIALERVNLHVRVEAAMVGIMTADNEL